ncbi:DUF1508 domain-containing protein [Actinokineospora auranticolor]|uniref:Uncharacterized protein YegP (UPF0339 family) n=1 Tax=Actinokineospora auranticolor TaxID=155976 RepID=A0A2S6GI09_9PSEU|nr:DUF1508 domain-containing protein [Actinokineospora auranticolor]PPK64868.1 uncharacterized protein YegP (UPF0339 family) [Actinokineospora auranticolor]
MARFQCYRVDGSGVRWRLLGGNNRVLGLGIGEHRNRDEALVEIDRVRRVAGVAWVEVQHAENGQWWWRLCVEAGEIVQSAQGFARRIDAEHAAARFQVGAPDAEVTPVVAVFNHSRRGRIARFG